MNYVILEEKKNCQNCEMLTHNLQQRVANYKLGIARKKKLQDINL